MHAVTSSRGEATVSDFQSHEPPRKRTTLRRILFSALSGAVLAVGVFFLLIRVAPSGPQQVRRGAESDISVAGFDLIAEEQNQVILHVKPAFVVNLKGLGGRRVMRVQIRLAVDSRRVAVELNENPVLYHRMVDEILRILKSKTYAELIFGDGIERLKRELRDRLNRYLTSGRIERVIFHELLFDLLPDYPQK